MQKFVYFLFQLDEARRYIKDGRLAQLRTALLLLDNTAEIQLDRQINLEISYEEMQEKLRDSILSHPHDDLPRELREIVDWTPLSKQKKTKISRRFHEKVWYVTERKPLIDSKLAQPLLYLHKYRNEAYHRAQVRQETIYTAALLYLELNCLLLKLIYESSRGYSSGDDFSWLEERFEVKIHEILNDSGFVDKVAKELRSGLIPDKESVCTVLMDHLESRIEDLANSLDFIISSLQGIDTREDALRESQLFLAFKNSTADSRPDPLSFQPKYQENDIILISKDISGIAEATDSLDAFSRFSNLEEKLELIESSVDELSTEVDKMIQLEIDIRRGK